METRYLFLSFPVALGTTALLAISSLTAGTEHIVVSGFQTPESAVHDTIADLYLVSNVGLGNPGALDHNGFISQVSPEGVILQLKWIEDGVRGATLNGPKGLWLHREALYVADIDTLRIFDRSTGAPLHNVPLPNPFAPNPLFLNDVAVANNGTIYVTDTRNNAIFTVDPEGNASILAAGPQLGNPNGILLDGGNVSWVTFFGHEVKRMRRSGKLVTEATLPAVDVSKIGLPPGTLFLDGYCRFDGSLLVTSWVTGRVYRIGRSGKDLETVAQFVSSLDNPASPDGPADINVDESRDRLLIPLFNANQLVIVQLED
jgi:outer membrane protein assembly factor BamB